MDRHIIRTSETDSVKGVASRQYIDVNLRQTSKTLPFPNISTILSQRSKYEEERQAANNFRLIVTIVPYCSNVLFNSLTEIVKDEGSNNPDVVHDNKEWQSGISGAIGTKQPDRIKMILNTEYSSPQHGGYDYHPGYDFFDNHLLRNKTFKLVNDIGSNTGNADVDVFNTIEDYSRYRNGEKGLFHKRLSIGDDNTNDGYKHLYIVDDILKIDESINQNLYEENGWWGFINKTSIDSKKIDDSTKLWDSLDISKPLNNHNACEFIDMYPDRTLFSFSPKYNKFKRRNENNWNVVITYPYKNVYSHPICLGGSSYIKRRLNEDGEFIEETVSEGNRWMGLKVMNVQIGNGKIGGNTIVFRTYTKHGLSPRDSIYIYYTNPFLETDEYSQCEKFGENDLNGKDLYYESETYYAITDVGDSTHNDEEYNFYMSNFSFIKELYKSYIKYVEKLIRLNEDKKGNEDELKKIIPFYTDYLADQDHTDIYDSDGKLKQTLIGKILKYSNFRIRRSVKGVKSTYYLRMFRKIPNRCAAQREMTEEEMLHTSKFNGVFENYINENALDPNNQYQRLIKNEQYQMAFASNIYNDNITQILFMDGINTKGLTDNLGRPLSELYYTIVKNNAGYKLWYDAERPSYGNDEVEFSHCFGKVTSALEMHFKRNDSEEVTGPKEYLKKLSSANHISNIINDENGIYADDISNNLETDIDYRNTFFYGDLAEFNAVEFQERHIANVMHRFNTAQRELIKNRNYSQYQYHEILEDDYDPYPFEVGEFSAVNGLQDKEHNINDYETIARPEGYIYAPHYRIPIREFTDIKEGYHYTLNVRRAEPVNNNGILIRVKTKISHGLTQNDIIYICDESNDVRYVTRCAGVLDKTTFLMSPNYEKVIENATDFEDIEVTSNYNNVMAVTTEDSGNKNQNKYIKRWNYVELCNILNGEYDDDIEYPNLRLRKRNEEIPQYATYVGGNAYVWRNIINIGDSQIKELPDYIFANGYFYITNSINFFLKRQDPFGNNGLYFDGEDKYPYFPNDPSGILQKENNYVVKDTETGC